MSAAEDAGRAAIGGCKRLGRRGQSVDKWVKKGWGDGIVEWQRMGG